MEFSFKWFLDNNEIGKEEKLETISNTSSSEKPYRSLKMVSTVITVVLNDGSIVTKENGTLNDFNVIRNCKSEMEVFNVLMDRNSRGEHLEQQEVVREVENMHIGIDVLKTIEDFEIEENVVRLKGINRTLPQLLVKRFSIIAAKYENNREQLFQDEEYVGLKRFFMWCCLNPRAEVADKLYGFLEKNGMKITKQGLFVGLRNVVKVNDDTELIDFVSNSFIKVKAVWKKHPKHYTVYKDGGDTGAYAITSNVTSPSFQSRNHVVVGNLFDLYTTLPENEENRYTDHYTQTFDIRIGRVVSMPMEECSWSTADCAHKGLHFAGHTAPYVLCGDTTVFTLHNPMKVVGVGEEKGRCYEYLPFMTTSVKEADEIMNSREFDFLQLDEKYAIDELEHLEENVKNGFAKEANKHEFHLPTLSSKEMKDIISSLEEIQKEVEKRVVKI